MGLYKFPLCTSLNVSSFPWRKKLFVLVKETFFFLMLRQSWRKRHLINLPPPLQNGPFGGGVSFWNIFRIFGFRTQKNFWNDFGAKPMFWNNYRPIPATSGHFMNLGNSKNLEFSVFLGKFGNFFFKIRFWTKLVLESLNMVFLTFFRSWRWFISIFDPFLSFYNFEFSCIFYVEICRFRQFWRNMKGNLKNNKLIPYFFQKITKEGEESIYSIMTWCWLIISVIRFVIKNLMDISKKNMIVEITCTSFILSNNYFWKKW